MSTVLGAGVCAEARKGQTARLLVLFVLALALSCGPVGLRLCSAAQGAQSETPGERESGEPTSAGADALYQRYRSVVERNIFSRFARSPRPAPPPEVGPERRPEAPRPASPGAGHILTGVVTGGEEPLALVEETASGKTRVYRVGTDTPAGRLQTIDVEGVVLDVEGGPRLIRVGYTLSGERSQKLSRITSTVVGGPPATQEAGAPEGPRRPGRGGRGAAAPRITGSRREEIMRRLRERRLREERSVGGQEEEKAVESEAAVGGR